MATSNSNDDTIKNKTINVNIGLNSEDLKNLNIDFIPIMKKFEEKILSAFEQLNRLILNKISLLNPSFLPNLPNLDNINKLENTAISITESANSIIGLLSSFPTDKASAKTWSKKLSKNIKHYLNLTAMILEVVLDDPDSKKDLKQIVSILIGAFQEFLNETIDESRKNLTQPMKKFMDKAANGTGQIINALIDTALDILGAIPGVGAGVAIVQTYKNILEIGTSLSKSMASGTILGKKLSEVIKTLIGKLTDIIDKAQQRVDKLNSLQKQTGGRKSRRRKSRSRKSGGRKSCII